MIIHHDPDEWKSEVKITTCGFHQRHPGKPYAGCSCSAIFGNVRRSPEEVVAIKREKRIAHEDQVLAEAEAIRARRLAENDGQQ